MPFMRPFKRHKEGIRVKSFNTSKLTQAAIINAYNSYDLDEALKYIRMNYPIRTTAEELRKMIERKAGENNTSVPDLEKDLSKAVGLNNFKNWKNGTPISRESAIKIAFALHMDYEEADLFLTQSCWHEGFYLRDYKDIIYRYCLCHDLGYEKAISMIKKHTALDEANPVPKTNIKNL